MVKTGNERINLELAASDIIPLMHILQVFNEKHGSEKIYYQTDLLPVAMDIRGKLSKLWEMYIREDAHDPERI